MTSCVHLVLRLGEGLSSQGISCHTHSDLLAHMPEADSRLDVTGRSTSIEMVQRPIRLAMDAEPPLERTVLVLDQGGRGARIA
jgi:hypothetical protein